MDKGEPVVVVEPVDRLEETRGEGRVSSEERGGEGEGERDGPWSLLLGGLGEWGDLRGLLCALVRRTRGVDGVRLRSLRLSGRSRLFGGGRLGC